MVQTLLDIWAHTSTWQSKVNSFLYTVNSTRKMEEKGKETEEEGDGRVTGLYDNY